LLLGGAPEVAHDSTAIVATHGYRTN
jgi:hypothetical protein